MARVELTHLWDAVNEVFGNVHGFFTGEKYEFVFESWVGIHKAETGENPIMAERNNNFIQGHSICFMFVRE